MMWGQLCRAFAAAAITAVISLVPVVMVGCGGTSTQTTATYLDTGVATTSTTFSVPAGGRDITPEQIRQLMARYADIPVADLRLDITDNQTFGDWAAAKVIGQMEATGLVFRRQHDAWFFWGGIVDGNDAPRQLEQLQAPKEVSVFFGY